MVTVVKKMVLNNLRSLKKLNLYKSFPVLAILGPRQSGKTTLAKNYFKDYEFVNLESGLAREYAINDPAGFLNSFKNAKGVIIDEFQNAPDFATILYFKKLCSCNYTILYILYDTIFELHSM